MDRRGNLGGVGGTVRGVDGGHRFVSARLVRRLVDEGWSTGAVGRIDVDFSDGRAEVEPGWARHNERVQAAVALRAREVGLDAALALAAEDWRDALVAGGLADEGWPARLDAWFAAGTASS